MNENEDIVSMLNSLTTKIEDLEIRVGEILTKQLYTKKELDLIQEKPEEMEEALTEDKIEVKFPEDYHFTEDLDKLLESMVTSQKAWLGSVQNSKYHKTGLRGVKIFDEMNKHLMDRLDYLEVSKTLIQGPLLEDLPPPEEPPEEEETKEEKGKKAKKGASKKAKKK